MPSSPTSFETSRFISVATEIANRLDFASRFPGDRLSLAKRLFAIERLWWDLRVYAAAAGLDGVPVVEAATAVRDELATAVDAHDEDGNLEPWARCRDRVREQIDRLRSMMPADPVAVPAVAQAVAVAPAAPRQSRDATGGKGERGEKAWIPPGVLSGHAARVVSLLFEHNATSEADRVTRAYVCEDLRLSEAVVRRAVEQHLKPRGLLNSKLGRDGGIWLTDAGIESANTLAAK
ncbi:MAG: hypothetical protein ACKOEM_00965 [Planctomycetia bacterium]